MLTVEQVTAITATQLLTTQTETTEMTITRAEVTIMIAEIMKNAIEIAAITTTSMKVMITIKMTKSLWASFKCSLHPDFGVFKDFILQ